MIVAWARISGCAWVAKTHICVARQCGGVASLLHMDMMNETLETEVQIENDDDDELIETLLQRTGCCPTRSGQT